MARKASDSKSGSIPEFMIQAGQHQLDKFKLVSKDLRTAFTPGNIDKAVMIVNYIHQSIQDMSLSGGIMAGEFLVSLKISLTTHGEWMKFCSERFPTISHRTINRWMQRYLISSGEKKPKELPAISDDDADDVELLDAMMNPKSEQDDKLPRAALVDHNKKLRKGIEKGQEQLAALSEQVAELTRKLEQAQQGYQIPEHVKDETLRVEHLRNQFWGFVKAWKYALPRKADLIKLHSALYSELRDEMNDLWINHFGDFVQEVVDNELVAKAKKARKE